MCEKKLTWIGDAVPGLVVNINCQRPSINSESVYKVFEFPQKKDKMSKEQNKNRVFVILRMKGFHKKTFIQDLECPLNLQELSQQIPHPTTEMLYKARKNQKHATKKDLFFFFLLQHTLSCLGEADLPRP